MAVTIYHNPRCSKSRQTLQLLRDRGVEPTIVEYLQDPPSVTRLKQSASLSHSWYGCLLQLKIPSTL